MSEVTESRPWLILERLVETGDPERLAFYLEGLPPAEAARALAHLERGTCRRLVTLLDPDRAAELLEELPAAQAVGLIEELPAAAAASIVEALPGQEQGDVLGPLPDEDAEAILEAMSPEAASSARRIASYEPDTAGGLMETEALSFRDDCRVQDVLDDLRANAERYADFAVQYAYVVDASSRLDGVLPLRDLLLAAPDRPIRELMIASPRSVQLDDGLEELASFFEETSFLGVPVVDDDGVMAGIVRRSDLAQALGDRERSDHLKTVGIVGGEELRSLPTWLRARRRLGWLSVNVVLNVVAASVIAAHQDTLAAVIALAVFLPIISDMSGCSGTQAVAVTMRELSLGIVRPADLFHVLGKELTVGLVNGTALGSLLAFVAWAWKGNPWLGLVVGVALAFNTMVAVAIGGTVPLLLKRLGRDPALASGPILTTCTDTCGFLAVLGLASVLLPRLTG
ncbi:MAG: magnesium transporter [Acidobacteriota bacterium]